MCLVLFGFKLLILQHILSNLIKRLRYFALCTDNLTRYCGVYFMLGPIGSNLMAILKVLTPSEIDAYSEKNTLEAVLPIAVGGEAIHQEQYGSNIPQAYKKASPQDDGKNEEDDGDGEESKAKIIPINAKAKAELESLNNEIERDETVVKNNQERQQVNLSTDKNSLDSIGILSASQMRQIKEQEELEKNKNKDSTTVFILNQRKALKQSQYRLVEQKAIKEYQKNAATEFIQRGERSENDEDLDDELMDDITSSRGILVNKRHY